MMMILCSVKKKEDILTVLFAKFGPLEDSIVVLGRRCIAERKATFDEETHLLRIYTHSTHYHLQETMLFMRRKTGKQAEYEVVAFMFFFIFFSV